MAQRSSALQATGFYCTAAHPFSFRSFGNFGEDYGYAAVSIAICAGSGKVEVPNCRQLLICEHSQCQLLGKRLPRHTCVKPQTTDLPRLVADTCATGMSA